MRQTRERRSDYNLFSVFSPPSYGVRELADLPSKHSWNFLRSMPARPYHHGERARPNPKTVGMSGVLVVRVFLLGGEGDGSTWQTHHSLRLLRHISRKGEECATTRGSFSTLSLWTLHLLFARPNLVLNLCPARFQTTTGRLDTMEPNSVHGVGERREGGTLGER